MEYLPKAGDAGSIQFTEEEFTPVILAWSLAWQAIKSMGPHLNFNKELFNWVIVVIQV